MTDRMIGSRILAAAARWRRPTTRPVDAYPRRERLTEVIAWGIAISALTTCPAALVITVWRAL